MNYNVAAMVARWGTPRAVRLALATFHDDAPAPHSDEDARRALIAAAEKAAGPAVYFDFDLPTGTPGCRGGTVHKIVSVGQTANGMAPVTVKPAGCSGDPFTVMVPAPDSLKDFTTLSNAVAKVTGGRVSTLKYPKSPVPGAPALVPASPTAGPLTGEQIAQAAKAAGIDKEGVSVLCRLAADGQFRKLDVPKLAGLMGRVAAAMVGRGLSGAEAVRAVCPKARFSRAEFSPANADATGQRSEQLPGGYTVVRVDHGQPVVVTCRPIDSGNSDRDRRIPIDVQALNDFDTLRSALQVASGGSVVIVQPDADAAREITGWPDRLTAPEPTGTGNGKITNQPGGLTVGMAGPMNLIDAATHLALAKLAAKKEALSRTVGTAGVSAATSSEAFRQAAEEALWQVMPGTNQNQVRAKIDADRRRAAMESTPLGREVLAREQAEDARRR
jgi:hypothetical protein